MALILGRENRTLIKELLAGDRRVYGRHIEESDREPSFPRIGLEETSWSSTLELGRRCMWSHVEIGPMARTTWIFQREAEGTPDKIEIKELWYATLGHYTGILIAGTSIDMIGSLEEIPDKLQTKTSLDPALLQQAHVELQSYIGMDS